MNNSGLVIIGGGVVGLSSALYCLRRGMAVTVLSRELAADGSCASGSAGMVVPSHVVPLAAPGMVQTAIRMAFNPKGPFSIRPSIDPGLIRWGLKFIRHCSAANVSRAMPLLRDLNLASRNCFVEFANESGNPFGLVQKGLLMLCRTTKGWEHEKDFARVAAQAGLEAQVLSSTEIESMEPDFDMDVEGAVFFPQDCHLNPAVFLQRLESEVRELGGIVHQVPESEEVQCTAEADRVVRVHCGDRTFETDQVLLACGSRTAMQAAKLGIDLLLQPGKGYSLTLEKPVQLPRHCAILTEARVAVTPMGSTLRFAGTMQFEGHRETIDRSRLQGIVESAGRYFPAFKPGHFDLSDPWYGFRPCTPDGLPYLGRSRRLSNLLIATGHAMMGLSLAPITGKIIAALAHDEDPGIDIGLLAPERFSAN